jgi:hypothetical protein
MSTSANQMKALIADQSLIKYSIIAAGVAGILDFVSFH